MKVTRVLKLSFNYIFNVFVANFLLRVATLLSKFVFLIYVTRNFKLEEFADYGVFSAVVTYVLYALGLEIYTVTQRKIVQSPSKQELYTSHQLWVYFVTHFMFILAIILVQPNIEFSTLIVFFTITSVEHLNQEINRLAIALGKPTVASTLLFLRVAAWGWLFIISDMILGFESLRDLLIFWLVSVILAFVLGIQFLRSQCKITFNRPKWRLILQILKLSAPIVVASLSFRLFFVIDRIYLDRLGSPELAASYIFYMSLTMALISLYDSAYLAPNLRKFIEHGRYGSYWRTNLSKVIIQSLCLYLGIFMLSIPFVNFVAGATGKAEVRELISVYYITGAIGAAYVLNVVVNFALYTMGRDIKNAMSNIFGILVSSFCIIIVAFYNLDAQLVLVSLMAGFLTMFAFKLYHITRVPEGLNANV